MVHNNKYIYDKTQYVFSKYNIIITCPSHGDFIQKASKHLFGQGCAACSQNKRYTVNSFIQQAHLIHNKKYLYDKIQYKNNRTPILIGCITHGYFLQIPYLHLKGNGCKKCKFNFIIRANLVHKNKYNYNNINYINSNTNVMIVCNIHGQFNQNPFVHLKGGGCPKCGCIIAANKHRISLEDFIVRANNIHDNAFDYTECNYIHMHTKVIIICKNNHHFEQEPANHLQGHGCPKCKESRGEKRVRQCLIKHKISFIQEYRIKLGKGYKSFDFYIPDYNMIIEYNGQQHYIPVDFGATKPDADLDNLKRNLISDKQKKQYCLDNNIQHVEIKYWEYDNINNILDFVLRSNVKHV